MLVCVDQWRNEVIALLIIIVQKNVSWAKSFLVFV